MLSSLRLIVGLGNPGAEYAGTRHNAGCWFVDSLAAKHSLTFKLASRFKAYICRLQTGEIDCLLCKPVTFVNDSGLSVQALTSFYKIRAGSVLVAHDELDLGVGVARLREGGDHNGHNGLRDIITRLGDASFMRLRLGINRPATCGDVTAYVLGKPGLEDQNLIDDAIGASVDVMPLLFAGQLHKAMNILHDKRRNNRAM